MVIAPGLTLNQRLWSSNLQRDNRPSLNYSFLHVRARILSAGASRRAARGTASEAYEANMPHRLQNLGTRTDSIELSSNSLVTKSSYCVITRSHDGPPLGSPILAIGGSTLF